MSSKVEAHLFPYNGSYTQSQLITTSNPTFERPSCSRRPLMWVRDQERGIAWIVRFSLVVESTEDDVLLAACGKLETTFVSNCDRISAWSVNTISPPRKWKIIPGTLRPHPNSSIVTLSLLVGNLIPLSKRLTSVPGRWPEMNWIHLTVNAFQSGRVECLYDISWWVAWSVMNKGRSLVVKPSRDVKWRETVSRHATPFHVITWNDTSPRGNSILQAAVRIWRGRLMK